MCSSLIMWLTYFVATLLAAAAASSAQQYTDVIDRRIPVSKYPFLASLRSDDLHLCACSILTNRWLLTAAHCVLGLNGVLSVQYGVNRISPGGPNVVRVKRFIVHTDFRPMNSSEHDIALIELKRPLLFVQKLFGPVDLPEATYLDNFSNLDTVQDIGWTSCSKRIVEVESQYRKEENLGSNLICASTDGDVTDMCSEDTSAILVSANHTQIGILTWRSRGASMSNCPCIYTNVAAHIDWITETIMQNSS